MGTAESGTDIGAVKFGGRIVGNGVKTLIEGDAYSCVKTLREFLVRIAGDKPLHEVALDVLSIKGEERRDLVSSASVIVTSDTGEVFAKKFTPTQTYALMCALGTDEGMQSMPDEEIYSLLRRRDHG